jgi:hypothetical protein
MTTSFQILFSSLFVNDKSFDSAVGTASGHGLDDQGVGVRALVGAKIFTSPCRPDRTHQASYPMSTGGSFLGGKAAGAWSWPLTSN